MLIIRPRTLILLACLFETAWLLAAQTLGYTMILLPCLAAFLVLVAWAAMKGISIPVLLFFLPFSALLKTSPGQTSFFTIALLIVYVINLVLGRKRASVVHAIPAAAIVALCLLVKTFYDYDLDNSFMLFAASLLLTPYVAVEFGKKYDFYWLTLFFTIGIVLAAISSLYLIRFSTIAQYIEYLEISGVVRHSGYFGDPNFYSAHISAALAGVLILLLNNTSKMKMVVLILMAMLLVYCGLLSVSKTFALVAVFLVLLFILEFLFQRGKVSAKLLLLLTFVVGVLFLLSSTAFWELMDMIIYRFSGDTNLSDFTTRRTELWIKFYYAFKEDTLLLMFGKGYTDVMLITRGAHNTVIQSIYQFGIVGCVAMVGWLVCCIRVYLANVNIKWNCFTQICILLVGTIGPWMALDLLFFDEFFLMPMYVCVGIISIAGKSKPHTLKKSKGVYLKYGNQRQ